MSELHEVLAVIGNTEIVAANVIDEAIKTFGKSDRFMAHSKNLKMISESREAEEAAGAEVSEMATTVQRKLDYVRGHIERNLDAILQKEATNQKAKADVVLEDGTVVLTNVPVGGLLALENKIPKWRAMYAAIPTLQPGIDWILDLDKGDNVFVSKHDVVRNKTEKITEPVILYEATKEHPAQVKEVSKDIVVGVFTTRIWSGMITPARKSVLLGRLDELLRSVTKARMRANKQEIVQREDSKKIFDFIHAE
ncbi:MAG: hypothetical protein ACFFD1_01945 [Candidatus Thorarchaeota archaeon]